MIRHQIGAIELHDRENPIGIIAERDIGKQIVKGKDVLKRYVKEFLSKPMITEERGDWAGLG